MFFALLAFVNVKDDGLGKKVKRKVFFTLHSHGLSNSGRYQRGNRKQSVVWYISELCSDYTRVMHANR